MIRKRAAGCTLAWILLFAPLTDAQQPLGALPVTSSAPGLELLQGQVMIGHKKVAITLVRGSLDVYHVELGVTLNSGSGESVVSFQERSQAAAVISGGFLTSFYPPIPLGAVKHAGALVNRPAGGDLLTGLLLVARGKPSIQKFRGEADLTRWDEALQSGPMLLAAGRSALPDATGIRTQSTRLLIGNEHSRAFIALSNDGRFMMAVTGAVGLPALADFLARPAAQGGLACVDALSLGGGGSEGILVSIGGRRISAGNTQSYLANAILIKPAASTTLQRARPTRGAAKKR